MTTGKTIALSRQTFVGIVMSLLFNMLSRLVITFLSRSKRLLISWLQSPSAVILNNGSCNKLNVCVSPQIHSWNSSPKVLGSVGRTFGRQLGHEGEALMNGTSKSSLDPSTMWGYNEKIDINKEASPNQRLNLPIPWSLTSQPPELWEIDVCCLYTTVMGILLQSPKQAQTRD